MSGSIAPCLFCGATGVKLTVEDVYPKWLRGALNIRGDVTLRSGSDKTIRSSQTLELRLRDVCDGCNRGWLSNLETSFSSIMTPAMAGSAVSLDERSQRIAATWAIKTWLLLERGFQYLRKGPVMRPPTQVFRWLKEHEAPPPHFQVWLGAVDAVPARTISWLSTQLVVVPPNPPIGIAGIFTIGELVFQVYTPATAELMGIGIQGDLTKKLIPIWPNEVAALGWPPSAVFTVSELNRRWPSHGFIQPVTTRDH